jgi:hypothetical protein
MHRRQRQNAGSCSRAPAPRCTTGQAYPIHPRRTPDLEPTARAIRSHRNAFFLDCFPRDQLGQVIRSLYKAARLGGYLLMSDFQIPPAGFRRIRAQIIHWLMYRFFRVATNLPASALISPQPFLRQVGFIRVSRAEFDRGLLYTELWKRPGEEVTCCFQGAAIAVRSTPSACA